MLRSSLVAWSSTYRALLRAVPPFVAASALLCACSEGTSNDPRMRDGGGASDAGGVRTDAGVATDAGFVPRDAGFRVDAGPAGGDAGHGASDAGATGLGGLVVNELSADGDDWVELFNAGATAVDVSSLRIADRDADGSPRVSKAITIPEATMIAPGEYLFVLADQGMAAMPGFQTACGTGGPPRCLQASWGLSKTEGDTISLLAADDSVLVSGEYPPSAVATGQTWGRIPNGTGAFTATSPTPGRENAAAVSP